MCRPRLPLAWQAPLVALVVGFAGLLGDMLNDPPGFVRSVLPAVNLKLAGFFKRHLLTEGVAGR